MTRDAHQALVAADSMTEVQCPLGFDYQGSLTKVRKIKSDLEELVGSEFTLDDSIQDATYYASLYFSKLVETPFLHNKTAFALDFSSFGNLFTIAVDPTLIDVPESLIRKVVQLVESYGFAYVHTASLDAPYDGPNPSFASSTWRHRFFDYL